MGAVTVGAVDARAAAALGEMAAGLELRELLLMTPPTHRQCQVSVGFADEISHVSFHFVGLRRIAAVTAGAADTGFAVRACAVNADHFASASGGPGMTLDAVVVISF